MLNSIQKNLYPSTLVKSQTSENLKLITKKTTAAALGVFTCITLFPVAIVLAIPSLYLTAKLHLVSQYRKDMATAETDIFKRSYVIRYPFRKDPKKANQVFEDFKSRMITTARIKFAAKSTAKLIFMIPLQLIATAGFISVHTCNKVYLKTFKKLN